MTDSTANAAKLLHYAKHHMGCPKWGPSATAASKCECGLDDLADAVTRPQPAPPAGEPDLTCCSCGISMREPNGACKYPGNHPPGTLSPGALRRWLEQRAIEWGQPLLKRAADLIGLAARPKVEDAEIVAHVALLRMLGCVGGPLDHAAVRKAADLLEDRAGVVSDQRDYIQRLERLLNEASNQRDSANDKLAEREAELAKAQKLICYENMSLAEQECDDDDWEDPTTQLTGDEIDEIIATAREQHAARQQQKASAEPTAQEGNNG